MGIVKKKNKLLRQFMRQLEAIDELRENYKKQHEGKFDEIKWTGKQKKNNFL